MTDTPDNPPAFPSMAPLNHWGDPFRGMDLRDHFASLILPALIRTAPSGISFGASHEANNMTYANVSYSLADAMLAARKQPK